MSSSVHWTARHSLGVHDLGVTDPGPFGQDLANWDILGDDGGSPVGDLHRQLAG